jgi:hypothetical protein
MSEQQEQIDHGSFRDASETEVCSRAGGCHAAC